MSTPLEIHTPIVEDLYYLKILASSGPGPYAPGPYGTGIWSWTII